MKEPSLLEKQQMLVVLTGRLIDFCYKSGKRLTYGETFRTKAQALIYAMTGKGVKNSLHCIRLAVDFNLFEGEKWLTSTEDFRFLGEYWESLSTPGFQCCWGGRFGDGNHFSISHNGIK